MVTIFIHQNYATVEKRLPKLTMYFYLTFIIRKFQNIK